MVTSAKSFLLIVLTIVTFCLRESGAFTLYSWQPSHVRSSITSQQVALRATSDAEILLAAEENAWKKAVAKSKALERERFEQPDGIVIELPSWWEMPHSELEAECTNLCGFFNQVEPAAVVILASQTLRKFADDPYACVVEAEIMAIGPAGMIVRGKRSDEEVSMIDLHVEFALPANDELSIRAAVMATMTSLPPTLSKPEPPTIEEEPEIIEEPPNEETAAVEGNEEASDAVEESVEFPSWWVVPEGDTAEEVKFLRGFVNGDDFSTDLVALASKNAAAGEQFQAQQVSALEIGPAGLILRATIKDDETLDVAVPFPRVTEDIFGLRDAVFRALSTAKEVPRS